MPNRHQALADRVLDAFKDILSEAVREQITESQYTELSLMIQEALSEELENAINRVEEVVKNLRTEVEKPELGL